MVNAGYLAQPRLKLLDESRRVVRVQNAPPDAPAAAAGAHALARGRPPSRSGLEPVGKYHDRPNERDIDYRIAKTAAGDVLITLLADGSNRRLLCGATRTAPIC